LFSPRYAIIRAVLALAAGYSLVALGTGASPSLAQSSAPRLLYVHNGHVLLSDLTRSFSRTVSTMPNHGSNNSWWPMNTTYSGWSYDGSYFVVEPSSSVLLSFGYLPASVYAASGQLFHHINYGLTQSPSYLGTGPYWAIDSNSLVYTGTALKKHHAEISIWKEGLRGSLSLAWPQYRAQLLPFLQYEIPPFPVGTNDPATEQFADDANANQTSSLWSTKLNTGIAAARPSLGIARAVGQQLPAASPHVRVDPWFFASHGHAGHASGFSPGHAVVASTRFVAGIATKAAQRFGGRIVVAPLTGGRTRHFVGRGSDPTWSPDGKWLFYVQRTRIKTVRFRLRFEVPTHHGRPVTEFLPVTSAVNRISIIRVHPDGSRRQTIATFTGYGITSLNVLADNRTVVFEYVSSDQRLIQFAHRDHGITVTQVYHHYQRPLIETVTLGFAPRALMAGRDPVIQP
jgi:hypothetical protein